MELLVYALIALGVLICTVSIGLVLLVCIPWYLLRHQIVAHIEYAPPLIIGRRRPHVGAELCEFKTRDGLTLQGAYFRTPAATRQGVIVFAHEFHGDRWTAIDYVKDLVDTGFDVFSFDFRCHGDSDQHEGYDPMCWPTAYEVDDMESAIDHVCSRSDADPSGVGVIGISRGGGAAICAAATDKRVRALVCDGPVASATMQIHFARRFVTIYTRVGKILARMPSRVLGMVSRVGCLVVERRRNCKIANIEQAASKVEQPVLLIQGERDRYVPVEVIKTLRNGFAGRSRLWVVPKAKHNAAITVAKSEYQRRIRRFFLRHVADQQPAVVHVHATEEADVEPAMVSN